MSTSRHLLPLITLIAVAANAERSLAEVLTFTDLASWQAAVASSSLEDFEGATADDDFTFTPTTSPNGDLGLSAVEESTFVNNMLIDVGADGGFVSSGATFPGSGDAVVSLRFLDKDPVADEVTVTFPAGVSAFGFDYNIYDNQGDSVDVQFAGTNSGSLGTFSPIPPNPSTPSVGFIGVVDTGVGASIESFKISANTSLGTGSSVFTSFDNIRYGSAIPEPTALLLAAMGLLAAGRSNRSA